MYGTVDFLQGYADGFNGTKTCLEGRIQFSEAARKRDYTQGHSAGGWGKVRKEWSGLTPTQRQAKAERETRQAITRDYGYTDDAIKSLDSVNIAIGPEFPTEG